MSDVIKLLPDSVANQIAAGEVVQRPASVIKELVENSVDAGATMIKIIVKDAGRTLIQIVDNGCGMSPTDARMAFERHSTSKISGAKDLFALHTMGFRGEALASICAVSQVELRTMRKDDTIGTAIVIEGSQVISQEPSAGVPGSNFMVKNLFFNVPARRKFLKSDQVEMGHIMREFERMALVNPHIEFQLVHNDIVLHQLLPTSFKHRIVDIFGKSIDKQLVPVETDTSMVRISGFVSRPENARKRGALQYFMVNGRNMRHPYFHKAVMSCYEQLIPADEQPCYFINLTVDPATIDVNIHPTKSEIKFEEEQAIWKILAASVREGLGKFNAMPSIEFDLDDAPEIPVFNPDAGARHEVNLDMDYNPFATHESKVSSGRTTQDWDKLYADFARNVEDTYSGIRGSAINSVPDEEPDMDFGIADSKATATLPDMDTQQSTDVMQLKGRYILSPSKSGLMVVDQHRAHVRILYDRYIAMASAKGLSTQRVIFPEPVELSPSQSETLRGMLPELEILGFEIVAAADNCWEVHGLPSVMNDVNARELLLSVVDSPAGDAEEITDSVRHRIAMSMARVGAVKVGQQLSTAEMERLLSDLLMLPTPNYTPDGKLVLSIMPLEDIAGLFA